MPQDYPDWTRLFHLVGTDITIPINIEASAVTLPISIDAATVAIDVNLVASEVTMPVSIDAATVTIDVNLTASTVTIDINFSDQSVAVFDAAKWFAMKALQWGVIGGGSTPAGDFATVSRTTPANKTAYLCGIAVGYQSVSAAAQIFFTLSVAGVSACAGGFNSGGSITFDAPFRIPTGQVVILYVWNNTGSTNLTYGSIWGYDIE